MSNIGALNVYHYSYASTRTTSLSETWVKTINNQYSATTNLGIGTPGPSGTGWSGLVSAASVLVSHGTANYYFVRLRAYIPTSAGYSHWTVSTASRGGSRYAYWHKLANVYGADASGNALYNAGNTAQIYQQYIQDETGSDHWYWAKGYWDWTVQFRNNYSSTSTVNKTGRRTYP